ncbi:hypothetical protein [Myxococcus sp. NMCA1]|uniref:hypothetical protein n=1 Tax=Myxococcus sp. NMCA1 TaxID=2996785 RepID=UPI0022857DAC|nr:hypothetical protein [Myxococcus sp. NMCA1]WAM26874.1 hypothetical protein OZ403_01785 [Myxococcus sp. NMCA1]
MPEPPRPQEGPSNATDAQASEPFAVYLVRKLLAEQGFAPEMFAESELRVAVAQKHILVHFFAGTALPLILHEELAMVLMRQGREGEARTLMQPICKPGEDGMLPPSLIERGRCRPAP